MKYRNKNNLYVHNKDPVKERKNKRTLKNILTWAALGSLAVIAGCGWIKSDSEESTRIAQNYSNEFLQPAKEAKTNGDYIGARKIALRGYTLMEYSLGKHRHDINIRSPYCIAIGDSLYDLSQN